MSLKLIKNGIYRLKNIYENMAFFIKFKVVVFNQRNLKYKSLIYHGFKISFIEPIAAYYEIKDIFLNKIYHFFSQSDKPLIIDCGSYIGISVLYFKHVYPKSRILCFEPDPSLVKVLKKNITQNHYKNISIVPAGVGSKEDLLSFFPTTGDGGGFNKKSGDLIKVPVTKLSKYITKDVDLLKMNIEGYEYKVIKEIEKKLHYVNEIIIEYHCFDEFPQNLDEILNILKRNGFKYLVTDATSSKIKTPFSLLKKYHYFNLIYAKKWPKND